MMRDKMINEKIKKKDEVGERKDDRDKQTDRNICN